MKTGPRSKPAVGNPEHGGESHPAAPSSRPQGPSGSCTVLLMGETGSGKSTFINYLASYFNGGKLKSPKIVIPNRMYRVVTEKGYASHNETNLDDPTVSQTRKCTTYTFRKGSATYNFIDTPGLSDTTNSSTRCVDNETVSTILKAAGQAGELQAIILIINGTTARVTVNLKNALQRIAGNYPDVLLNNMIVVFTNAMECSRNFDDRSLVHQPAKTFTMNNSALSSLPGEWDEEDEGLQLAFWGKSMKKLTEIIAFIDQLAPQSTEVFRNMLASRNEINSQIFRATKEIEKQQQLVEMGENLRRQIADYEHTLSQDQVQINYHSRDIKFHESQEKLQADARIAAENSEKSIAALRSSATGKSQSTSSKLTSQQSQLHAAKQSQLSQSYYMETTQRTYPQKVDTSYHNTLCTKCSLTCHKQCRLDYTAVVGDPNFQNCACMGEDRATCTMCTCGFDKHIHDKFYYETITIDEEVVNEAKKEEYIKQRAEMKELELEIIDLADQSNAAQLEIQRYDMQLQSMSKQASRCRDDENRVRDLKNEALRKKQEIEQSIQAVEQAKTNVQSKLSKVQTELESAKQALRDAQSIVERKCRELKSICSKFNFVEELNVTKATLQTSLYTLRTAEARRNAEAFITTLDQLADGLTDRT